MAENSGIEWTHHTFNPWTGCTKISPACDHCYAEGWAKRSGHVQWGPHAKRRRTKTWGNPVKWNKALEGTGRRERVFCASLADVFDNHGSIDSSWRDELWDLIEETENLDWLLLTKRPQNIERLLPSYWLRDPKPNVWLGTTVENQKTAEQRIPHLLRIPAAIHFLSCEPLIGEINLREIAGLSKDEDGTVDVWWDALTGIAYDEWGDEMPCNDDLPNSVSWVITGGESGPNYRPANPDWFRALRDQCEDASVPFLFKQWEGKTQSQIKAMGRELDGLVHDAFPMVGAV
ncbi:DUF5131 family protein [uncultured Roseobacter sp.]|uniref:DUF5131 family protein n=1 Tax=uncultured Roseobacter sp. TaxID=114847 RepID=UPI00261F63AD|nr:phage Gp37/Gp68 family protein [uncultured Roseobacter sp.]